MIQQLEQILQAQNWGRYSFDIQETETEALIAAGIEDQDSWKIHLEVNPKLQELDRLLHVYSTDGVGRINRLWRRIKTEGNYFTGKDNIGNISYFVVAHEIGHWRYCPTNIDEREEIFSGVAEGLQRAQFTAEEIQQYSQTVYNYFADILDNVMNLYRGREKEKFQDGFLAFYAKEGLRAGGYSKPFYLLVDTIARLGINNEMKIMATAFRKDHGELASVTQQILTLLAEDETLARKVMNEATALDEKVKIYQALDDRERWHQKARDFAFLLAPYLKEEDEYENQQPHENDDHQQKSHQQGKGNEPKGPGNKQKSPRQGKGKQEMPASGNEKQLRELVKRSLEKGHSTAYAPQKIALDEIYRQRAEKIIIDMQKEQGESLRLPIGYLQRREMDENYPDLNKIDWQNPELGLDEQGDQELQFFERRAPYFADRKGSEKGGRAPNILFIIDKSGSVTGGYDPERGIGPYDMVLRSVYSTFKQLEDNDMIQQMRFGVVLFEGKPNYFSGWHSYFNLDKVKGPLLNPDGYESGPAGGTELDSTVIQEAIEASNGNFWAIIVSDGEIFNLGEACEAVSYLAGKGNSISFIDIRGSGYSTPAPDPLAEEIKKQFESYGRAFADHVRRTGGTVHPGSRPEDLPQMVLGKAQEIYGWE